MRFLIFFLFTCYKSLSLNAVMMMFLNLATPPAVYYTFYAVNLAGGNRETGGGEEGEEVNRKEFLKCDNIQ